MSQGIVTVGGFEAVNPAESNSAGPWFVRRNLFRKEWFGPTPVEEFPTTFVEVSVPFKKYAPAVVSFDKRTGRYRVVRTLIGVEYAVRRKRFKIRKRAFSKPKGYAMNLQHFRDADVFIRQFPTQSPAIQSSFSEWFSEPTSGSTWNNNDDIELLNRARRYIAGSDFNGAITNGELRKSLDTIRDVASRTAKALRFAKKGNFHEAFASIAGSREGSGRRKRQADVAADNWLELQYGLVPLYNDVKNAAQFLAVTLNGTLTRDYRIRLKKPEGVFYDGPFVFPDAEAYTRKQMLIHVMGVNTAQLAGIADPASLLWELTPYSFVLDWWVPVGDYLSAAGLLNSIQVSGEVVISTKSFFDSGAPRYSGGVKGGDVLLNDPSGFRVKRIYFDRVIRDDIPLPTPVPKPLVSERPWKHAASAVALLTSGRDFLLPDTSQWRKRPVL